MKNNILIGMFCFSCLCATALQAAPSNGKLTVWTSSENVKNALDESKAAFEKEMNATVEVTILNREVTGKFKVAAATKKGPDILVWANDVVGELAESGLIEPLQLSPSLRKAYLKIAVDAFTYKGKIYGYPYDLEAVALIYNKKLVPTPPETMDDLIRIAKNLNDKKTGQYGFLYEIGTFFFSAGFFTAGDGYIFKDHNGTLDVTDIGLDKPEALRGGRLLHTLVSEGVVPESTDYSVAFNEMTKGKLGMTINGPWLQSDLVKSKIDYGVAPLPLLGGKRPKPFVGSHGFMIRRSSDNKDLAKLFIEDYLVTAKGITTLYQKDPRGPCRNDVITELGAKDKNLLSFMQSVENGYPMPNVPEMAAVWSAMDSAVKVIISGRDTPENALFTAVGQINAGLSTSPKAVGSK